MRCSGIHQMRPIQRAVPIAFNTDPLISIIPQAGCHGRLAPLRQVAINDRVVLSLVTFENQRGTALDVQFGLDAQMLLRTVRPRQKGIAVGTTVTGRPPHRSVREELPHTAPPSGQTITKRVSLPVVIAVPCE